MNQTRRERRTHGTQAFPFQIYPSLEAPESDLVPLHWHPEQEIIVVEEGRVDVVIRDQTYEGRQGDVFFVGMEELHEIRGGPAGRFHAFVFPLDFLQFSRADLAQSELLAPLQEGTLCVRTTLPRESGISGAVCQELDQILRACAARRVGFQLLVKASLLRILALAAGEGMLEKRAGKNEYKGQLLRDIVAYLDEHCTERLRLADLAWQFGLSPQYFCTFFRENIGRTLTRHLNFLRTERASRLLRETDLPIIEIGLSVGYDNFSYFIKRFKECYGCTPSNYRKEHRP